MSIRKTKEKGITLIALMVTIIVIIILAGITISAIKGNSGIISKADESKSQTERTEVIEKAKMTISNEIVGNGGNELTRSELKEILEKYFIEVPEDYTMDTELTTKSEYGNYKIKVSEIYDRDIMIASEEESDDNTTITPSTPSQSQTSSSTGGNSSSSNNSTSGSTSNNGNTTTGGNTGSSGTLVSENSTTEIDVTGIEIDRQTATIDINGENTIQLNSKLTPTNANKNTEVKWTSKKKAVASISKTGLVTGKTVGNSMIMATSQNGYSAECLVVCQAKITGITVNPTTARIPVGQTITLIATTSPKTLTEKVTWKSRNEDVAKVDNNGNVTGIGKGVVEIIAQNPSGTIQAICTVTVSSGENRLMMACTEEEKSAIDEYFKYSKKVLNGEGLTEEEEERVYEIITKLENMASSPYLRGTITRDKIESIKFKKGEVPETGIVEQFDVSENENNSIIGYYTDENNNELYELTIVSQNEIITNKDSTMLFGVQSSLQSIDFENLFFKEVNNMRLMFLGCSSLTNLDVSKFDTSQVTDMSWMFDSCSSLTNLDASKFDTSQVTDMVSMFDSCSSLTSLDVSKFDTSQVTNMGSMFDSCSSLTSLDVSKFDTSQVTNMSWMFASCSSLTSLDVSKFDTSKVADMSYMFVSCSSLTSLDVSKFDTSKVADMSYMFDSCSNLISLDVSKFDTSQVTDMSWMFYSCSKLTSLDVSKFDTSQVIDMSWMFDSCSSLTNLDASKFDTSQVTDMVSMFDSCSSLTSLDVSKFDTSQVTNMGSMFDSCSSLTSLDVSKFDTNQVTNMGSMFDSCSSLTSLDVSKFDTSQVTSMRYMFYSCSRLTSLDASKFDTSKVTDMDSMFYTCISLTSLDVSKFDTSQVTNMNSMFAYCIKLSKIYVSEYNETTGKGWTTKNVTDSDNMFIGATELVGGNGTVYNYSNIDATYARIDKEGEPGYFTDINKSAKNLTIPELAVLSQFEGEYENIDRGIVIYIMKDADGDGKIDTPDWTNKTKMQETYDQFVWVPVKNAILDLSSTYSGLDDAGIRSKVQEQINVGKYPMAIKTNTAGDYIGVLYEFSEVTENNTTYVKVIPNSNWTPKSTTFREPAGLADEDTETNLKQINGILNTSYNSTTSFEIALQSQYNEMVKKVEEKGGFWVGRYETSSMSNSTTGNYIASNRIQVSSKRNTTNGINKVTWYRMYAQQKLYSELALENKTTSSMIWGSQYDQIMIWMKGEKSSEQASSRGKYYITNGAGKGNYGTISGVENDVYSGVAPTGSQDAYSTKNIFDLAGNVIEWSLEAYNTDVRVFRGGYYNITGASGTRPDVRGRGNPTMSGSVAGSRLTLY